MSTSDEGKRTPGTDVAIFEGQHIRRQWLDGRWYFSVIDVVGLLTESAEPRTYYLLGSAQGPSQERGRGRNAYKL
jgi:hypothetical protein